MCSVPTETDSLSYTLYFRLGSGTIDSDYRNNRNVLSSLRNSIDSIGRNNISRIVIRSYASPDGGLQFNERLSSERAQSARKLIADVLHSSSVTFCVESEGESWEGLKQLVSSDEKLSAGQKTQALKILNGSESSGFKKAALKRLPCYGYLHTTYYSRLRNSIVCAFYTRKEKEVADTSTVVGPIIENDTIPATPIYNSGSESEKTETQTVSPKSKSGLLLAVKTNLLYDVLLVPNIGIELPLGENWSVSTDWMYAWWRNNNRHNYWRIYGGELEARRWFGKEGRRALTGHHLGVYGQMLTYDFEHGGKGYLGDRWSYAAGLAYGYSMPIARRLNLDLCLGVGYMGGKYKEYVPIDECYVWQASKNRHFIGPTKAEVSLVWLLGKGGGR